jgi:hypothetical protein
MCLQLKIEGDGEVSSFDGHNLSFNMTLSTMFKRSSQRHEAKDKRVPQSIAADEFKMKEGSKKIHENGSSRTCTHT